MKTITGVVFDNDGVIVDSLPIYNEANTEVLGFQIDPKVRTQFNGRTEEEVCRIITSTYNTGMTAEEYCEKRRKTIERKLPETPLVHGVERVIRKLHEMGIPMSIGTSSLRSHHVLKTVSHQDLYSLFKGTICSDDVKNGKPDPEVFIKAAKLLGDMDLGNVLVFEDSVNGVVAANRAGMPVVFVPSYKFDYMEAFENAHVMPTLIVESFDDFDFNSFNFVPKKEE